MINGGFVCLSMSPAVRGVVQSRILVNYRVGLDALDTVLAEPFRAREVGETGKGLGTVCITTVEDARPEFVPVSVGVSIEMATHRVYAKVEGGGEHCVYVPWRGVSSGFQAFLLGSLLPTEYERADFRKEKTDTARRIRVDCGVDLVGVAFYETDREDVNDDSVFYSVESASTFLCEAGVEYSMTGDVYTGIETCPEHADLEPVGVADVRSNYFGKLGCEFDSAFRMAEVEHAWKPRR